MPDIAYLGPHDYTEDQLLNRLEGESPDVIAIDTETISLKDRTCIGVGIALNQREAVYFPILPDTSKHLKLLWKLLGSPATKAFFNALYDLYALTELISDSDWSGLPDGTPMPRISPVKLSGWGQANVQEARLPHWLGNARLADVAAMCHIQALPSGALADCARAYTGMKIDTIQDILPARKNMLDLDLATVARKCMDDCLATLRLYYKMGGPAWWDSSAHTWNYEQNWYDGCDPFEPTSYTVTQAMKDCYQVDMKLIPLLMRMSRRGIALRSDLVEGWYERISQAKLFFEDICSQEGFNPSSPQQVGLTLAARGNFLPFTKSKKQLATGEDILEGLTDPLAVVVLKHRSYTKLKSTYLEPMRDEERTHTHFRMDLSTARLSSYDHNLQNIPPRIREIFAPDSGTWSDLDDNEIEMRIFAHVTQDPVMLKAYADGSSIHAITQEALWPGSDLTDKSMRLRAKTFNFAMIFYALVKTLSQHTKLPEAICRDFREVWVGTYPTAYTWMQDKEEGEDWIENLYGRRCRLPQGVQYTWKHIISCRINYPIQSGAHEIVKRQMLACEGLGMDIALEIHDEILVDGRVDFPPELAHIHPELHTPFKVKMGPYWS